MGIFGVKEASRTYVGDTGFVHPFSKEYWAEPLSRDCGRIRDTFCGKTEVNQRSISLAFASKCFSIYPGRSHLKHKLVI